MDSQQLLKKWLKEIQEELEQVTAFWVKHSHDLKHGGFFTCLAEDGEVYDKTKYMWLQARQVWMYLRLYYDVPQLRKYDIKESAIKGSTFVKKGVTITASHVVCHDKQHPLMGFTLGAHFLYDCLVQKKSYSRCPFTVTADGKPTKIQRGLFSECFYVLAMSETWRATNNSKFKDSAVQMMQNIKHWCMVDDSSLGHDVLSGCEGISSLAVPMMALCVCEQMETCNINWEQKPSGSLHLIDWAIKNLLLHVKRDGAVILENVTPNGDEIAGSKGRLYIPGHAIECGWLLLKYALKHNNSELAEKACKFFIDCPFQKGWDVKHGGLFYFLDIDGYCPVQLEWNMKLWWPHCEAMIAYILAYKYKGDPKFLEKFVQVAQYTFSKFPDKENGEWYGYLSSNGEVSSSFKGGPWKGFFHVPRALYMCKTIIEQHLNS